MDCPHCVAVHDGKSESLEFLKSNVGLDSTAENLSTIVVTQANSECKFHCSSLLSFLLHDDCTIYFRNVSGDFVHFAKLISVIYCLLRY